jgi:phosphoribosylanthranilate isomerase
VSIERAFFVKICGLRDAGAAQAAVDAGADALGFILAPSKRQVRPDEVAEIVSSLDRSASHPSIVGVTVNTSPQEIARMMETGRLETIQLSGDESPEVLDRIEVPVIKVMRFPEGMSLEDAMREIDPWFAASKPVSRVIVEGHAPGSWGGTGTRADWSFVETLAVRYPIVLAGGLDPDNVGEAITSARPWGVDVSSGVETDGRKDASKIREFVRAARTAYDGLS